MDKAMNDSLIINEITLSVHIVLVEICQFEQTNKDLMKESMAANERTCL